MIALLAAGSVQSAEAGSVDVTTYHNDAQRTGWNANETLLTWANVGSPQFQLLLTVPLDEQVDAQALVVSAATLAANGVKGYPNDLVYVATENNSIYAIDSITGAVKLQTNLGTPVSQASLPSQCVNNSQVVGIGSTPVIDLSNGVMYVMAASVENGHAVYRLHELSLATLADVIPSVVVSASHRLSDGTVTNFTAAVQRQRPALLLSQGVVYAGFGSYCDVASDVSRGWLIGWKAGTMLPLATAALTNVQTHEESGSFYGGGFFLSALWTSGYGMSADSAGYIFAQTGNSDKRRVDNLPDSALKIAPGSMTVADYFTPSDYKTLDAVDDDLGSGGVMVVPDLPNQPHFAVGGGKDGHLFLYNRDNMGGFSVTGAGTPPHVFMGRCWCGPSYFVGSDGKPRVISSGGHKLKSWFIPHAKHLPLIHEAAVTLPTTSQDPGFLTSVSSNQATLGTAIIWAQTRATGGTVSLYAFAAPPALTPLFAGVSGVWPHVSADANIVPVVAGGKVFVPSYKQLAIFGLGAAGAQIAQAPSAPVATPTVFGPQYFGHVENLDVQGAAFTLALRDGLRVKVDAAGAIANHRSAPLYPGEAVEVRGAPAAAGAFTATDILRAKDTPAAWEPDVP